MCATDTPGLDGRVVEMHGLDDGRSLLITAIGLAVADDLGDLESRPRLAPPADPLSVGSWVPLQYDLSGSALTGDDLSAAAERAWCEDPDALQAALRRIAGSAPR